MTETLSTVGWPPGEWGRNPVSTMLTPPTEEPITVAEAKLRAGLDWPTTDPREDLMKKFLATARRKVETDACLAFLTQERQIQYDAVPAVLQLPVRPLQAVSIGITYQDGSTTTLDPSAYLVDLAGGRIAFVTPPTNLRVFQPWTFTVTAGYEDVDDVPPELVHLVGILVAHYATLGRDLALVDEMFQVPYGYDDLIAPWRPEVLT